MIVSSNILLNNSILLCSIIITSGETKTLPTRPKPRYHTRDLCLKHEVSRLIQNQSDIKSTIKTKTFISRL